MANDLITNINQAVSDFNTIKTAIINKGVAIPANTPTSEYGAKIDSIENIDAAPSNETILKKLFKFSLDYLCKNNFTGVLTESVDIFTLANEGIYLLKPADETITFTNLPSDVSHNGILLNYQFFKDSTTKDKTCIYFPFNEDIIIRHSWGANTDPLIQWQYLKQSNFTSEEYNSEIIKNVIKYSFMNNFIRHLSLSNEDWNNLTETGIYYMNPPSNSVGLAMPNFPGPDIFRWGYVIVVNLESVIFQIYYTNAYNSSTDIFTYREYKDNTWGNWLRIKGTWTK